MDRISIMNQSKETGGAALERPHRIAPRRPLKVQICLTPQERAQLSERAQASGFETLSAFVRARTLGPAGEGARRA